MFPHFGTTFGSNCTIFVSHHPNTFKPPDYFVINRNFPFVDISIIYILTRYFTEMEQLEPKLMFLEFHTGFNCLVTT